MTLTWGILKGRNCSVRSTCERWMTVDCERRNSCLRHRRRSPTCVCAPGHREFSAGQPCRWPGSSAFCPHTLSGLLPRPSLFSQPLFSILHTHRHHLHLFHPYNSTVTGVCTCIGSLSRNDRVFFGSHFPFFRVPHPASDNQLHRPQRAANLLELGSSHFAHRWLAKRWRIQHQASLARATPNSTALPRSLLSPSPSLIGRSREGPQRPPPSSSIPPFPSGKEGGDV